jgi:type I restriction enzyme S subunit
MIAERLRKSLLNAAVYGKLSQSYHDILVEDDKNVNSEYFAELPNGWYYVSIKDVIASNIGGGTPSKSNPKYWNGEIFWASVKDLNVIRLTETKDKITLEGLNNSSSKLIPKGNLIVCTRMGLGKIVFNDIDVAINQDLRGLIMKENMLKEYFFYFYKTLSFSGKGATVKGISVKELNNTLIPLPPLAEQKRIVEKLDQILPMIDALEKDEVELNDLMSNFPDKMRESILFDAIQGKLTDTLPEDNNINDNFPENLKLDNDKKPFDIKDNWVWTTLNYAGSWKAGATPLRSNSEFYSNGTIPWLKTADLNNSHISDIPEYITDKALNETSVKLQPKGTVLIAMYGATIGKLGILDIEATTNQACCGCITNDKVNNHYLFYYLMAYKKILIRKGAGGAQPNISRTKIVNTEFALPPLSEQKRIVEKLDQILPTIESLRI